MAKKFLLALDAGHGLDTPGKRCLKSIDPRETSEWWLNDRVSDFIAQRAQLYEGFETMRVDDITGKTDVSHRERCRRANVAGADLYLSNHHNAGVNGGSGGGLVAFCMRGGKTAKTWRDALYNAAIAAGGIKGNRSNPLQEKNFNVLVWSDMPAVLMEYGFMDSKTDVPIILTEDYARTVGYAVADCIAQREGLQRKRTGGFTDVPADAWYAEAVKWAVDFGIAKGVDAVHFGPDQLCTRAEAVTFLHRLYGSSEPTLTGRPFSDVNPDAWYYKAVLWAVQKGITKGVDDDHFCPNEPCTRGQIMAFIWRAEGRPTAGAAPRLFADVSEDSYYHDAVAWAVTQRIAAGMDEIRFCPDHGCTRAQMVTFLYRLNMSAKM